MFKFNSDSSEVLYLRNANLKKKKAQLNKTNVSFKTGHMYNSKLLCNSKKSRFPPSFVDLLLLSILREMLDVLPKSLVSCC